MLEHRQSFFSSLQNHAFFGGVGGVNSLVLLRITTYPLLLLCPILRPRCCYYLPLLLFVHHHHLESSRILFLKLYPHQRWSAKRIDIVPTIHTTTDGRRSWEFQIPSCTLP